ncbi:hypothetical protein JVU11DRAFT_5404 [Chiua virens]|nr:hypothetical protein JVU11DRAFT_5404 [Chiua virens]
MSLDRGVGIFIQWASEDVGDGVFADHHFEGQRSTLFDAIYIPSGKEHVRALAKNGRAIHWVREAFGHCKSIAAVGEGTNNSQNDEHGLIVPAVDFLRDVVRLPKIDLFAPGGH